MNKIKNLEKEMFAWNFQNSNLKYPSLGVKM